MLLSFPLGSRETDLCFPSVQKQNLNYQSYQCFLRFYVPFYYIGIVRPLQSDFSEICLTAADAAGCRKCTKKTQFGDKFLQMCV